MIIRKQTTEDIVPAQKMLYASWLETYPNKDLGITKEDIHEMFKDSLNEENINRRKERLEKMGENQKIIYVAQEEDAIIGVAFLEIKEKNKLRAIYVLPEETGKGVGSTLWEAVSKHIDPSKEIIVHVATYNERAIAFYKKLGFVDTGKRFTEERHRMPVSGVLIPEMEMRLEYDN